MQRNRSLIYPIVLFSLFLLPTGAFAHTGIATTAGFANGFYHPIGGFDHLLAMVAVGLWAAQLGGRSLWIVPGTFVAVMIGGGILGLSGIEIPFIEQGILLSVLIMGILIAGTFQFSTSVNVLTVSLFALFHGHAHGAEMPQMVGAISYCSGFILATFGLHSLGIGIGTGLQKFKTPKIQRFAGGAIALSAVCLAVI